jgi:hypothetical protein
METFLGPDGKPVVFEGEAYYSQDRRHKWNGIDWVPVKPPRYTPRWLSVALKLGFIAILIYAVIAAGASMSPTAAYNAGFFFGVVALIVVLVVLFRSAGSWGGPGIIVRILAVGLMGLRILALLARAHSG